VDWVVGAVAGAAKARVAPAAVRVAAVDWRKLRRVLDVGLAMVEKTTKADG
jgi:hypothetical protein